MPKGYERGSGTEFIQFLYIAKGSCGEVRAQLQIALDQKYIGVETHESLTALARRTSGMIANFIAHLQGTEYRGAKFSAPQRRASGAGSSGCRDCGNRKRRTCVVNNGPPALKHPRLDALLVSSLHTLRTLRTLHTLHTLHTSTAAAKPGGVQTGDTVDNQRG